MKRLHIVVCCALFILAFGVRLYGFSNPLADWHSWRQSDTAAVARNFQKFGIDLLHPRYDDLSNIQSGKDNPQGYRMVEFPIYQAVSVVTARAVPSLPIEQVLRLVSICFTAGSVVIIFLLLQRIVDFPTAIIGGLFYAVLPFSIFYGRTILPDPMATLFALLSLLLLTIGGTPAHRYALVLSAASAAAISVLVRPMAVFLLFPAAFLLWEKGRMKQTIINIFLFAAVLITPLYMWRQFITHY